MLLAAAVALAAGTSPVCAQYASYAERSGLVPQHAANRHGLERAWFTRVQLDTARTRVAHVNQHVSSTRGFTVHEVEYDGGKIIFTERDLDRFGDPLGKERALKLAKQKEEDLQRAMRNPKLTTKTIPDVVLNVVTDSGVVHSIDAQTGRTRWATRFGNPRFPSDAPGANDNSVAVVNGTAIYVLNQETGEIAWQRRAQGAPGAGPVVSNFYVFVPMVNGAIEAYQLDDYRQPPWIYRSHGRAIVQPIFTGANVAWPTDRGHLYVAAGNSTAIRYRLETNDPIVAQATALLPNRIVVASTDGYVYCIHEASGNVLWRFSTGEPIVKSPVVVGDNVYVVTDDTSLFCIESNTGLDKWWTSGVTGVIASSQTRLYCLSRSGRLMIVDPVSGSKVGSLPTETLDLRFVNKQTDRIIIGTRSGMLQCLREIQNRWPVLHAGVSEDLATVPPPAAATPADATAPPPVNPFGGGDTPANPFGTDPFGGDTGGTDSEPAETPAEDPFGSDPFG